jgi:hypothetical protein
MGIAVRTLLSLRFRDFIFGISFLLLLSHWNLFCIELINYKVPDSVIDTALKYKNVLEVGNNKGLEVKMFLQSVGLPEGNPYCQAFVYYCMSQNAIKIGRTGLANGYYNYFRNRYGRKDTVSIKNSIGIIVWKYKKNNSGHTGFILKKVGKNYIITLEGNTSFDDSSPDGRVFAGRQGVFQKIRRWDKPLGQMLVRGVIQ